MEALREFDVILCNSAASLAVALRQDSVKVPNRVGDGLRIPEEQGGSKGGAWEFLRFGVLGRSLNV